MKKKLIEYVGRIQDGGAEVLVKEYALRLDKNNFDVIVLCDDYKRESFVYQTLVGNNVKVISLFEHKEIICKIMRRLFGGRFRALLFDKIIKNEKPDIIHVHLESLETLRYSKMLEGVKLFYTCHNPPEMMIGKDNKTESEAARFLVEKYKMRLIGLHDEMADELNAMFDVSDTAVIKNGIDLKRFVDPHVSKQEKRRELGIPNDAFVIGNNGRFAYQKNQGFLIEIFNEIHRENRNSYLVLIGRGPLEEKLKSRVKELCLEKNVLFLSNRKDVNELLKVLDVFVFPSRFEGLGISLIEAQAAKIPCVVSDKIPSEAIRTDYVQTISLNESKEVWSRYCLKPIFNATSSGDLMDYEIRNVIEKLEMLYLNS